MIVDKLDLKNNKLVVRINSLDDLSFLKQIIEPNDFVRGRSSRKIKFGEEGGRQKSVKKSIWLTLKTTKVELENNLRIHGTVESEIEGIPLHSAHSLEIENGSEIQITKNKWKKYQIRLIEDAEAASDAPQALVCVLDDEVATFAHITPSGYTKLGSINLRLSKKRYVEEKNRGEKDIIRVVNSIKKKFDDKNVEMIVLGSPLFWKEIVKKKIDELYPEIVEKINLEDVSSGDEEGIREIIKGKALDKIMEKNQLSYEEDLVNNMFELLAKKSELVVYGKKDIFSAAEVGAIDILLLSENMMDNSDEITSLIENVEKNSGEVHIISAASSAGKKLNGLKGLISKLRFKTK